jgi:ATP-binding cassette subfamily B protein
MVDPPAGTVFVQGVDVREWDLRALRKFFGFSPQDSYLFSDSIKHNIGYGMDNPSGELLTGAIHLAALAQDLTVLNRGADTVIGERGLTLSGGQKQRAAIARALIGAPEVLVLDDAFSAVDAETEKRILTGVLAERRGKTTLIVSHRVSTLRNADQVAVLDKGRIVEYGPPQALMDSGGFYARTAALQRLGEGEGRGG